MIFSSAKGLREKVVYLPKGKRLHSKPMLDKDDVKSGLPTLPRYGWFTPHFIKTFYPEKIYTENMHYLFTIPNGGHHPDFKDGNTIDRIQAKYTLSKHWVKVKDNKGVAVGKALVSDVVDYEPIDIINDFAKNKEVVFEMYKTIIKPVMKEFSGYHFKRVIKDLKKSLAFILARFDYFDYDMMAIPLHDSFLSDFRVGFKRESYKRIINFLVVKGYCVKTHGIRSAVQNTLKDKEERYPITFDDANFVPSLLICDDLLLDLFKDISVKIAKKSKVKKVFMSREVELPIEPIDVNSNSLNYQVKESLINKKRICSSDNVVLNIARRLPIEFFQSFEKLGFMFNKDVVITSIQDKFNRIHKLYNKILEIWNNTDCNYNKTLKALIYHFYELFPNTPFLYFKKAACRHALQYIVLGRTDDYNLNKALNVPSDSRTTLLKNLSPCRF